MFVIDTMKNMSSSLLRSSQKRSNGLPLSFSTSQKGAQLHFSPHLLASRSSNIGIIALNRPLALNSLTLDMIRAMQSILTIWQEDTSLVATLLEGSYNEKTKKTIFCAGGDVKAIALDGLGHTSHNVDCSENKQHHPEAHGFGKRSILTADFFREEYELNYNIAMQQGKYQKPQISLWDGIVMGGGVGLSIHGSFRVATENTLFAMPETGIGFFPDVGTTFWLSRIEKQHKGLGMFLGLTGWKLHSKDLLFANIATHYIHSTKLPNLKKELFLNASTPEDVLTILDKFHIDPNEDLQTLVQRKKKMNDDSDGSFIQKHMEEINSFFSSSEENLHAQDSNNITVLEILHKLSVSDSLFAQTILSHLRKMSPTSLVVTAEGIQLASQMEHIHDALQMEYRICQGFIRHHYESSQPYHINKSSDFYEGVRAVLIEKDGKPIWNPKRVEDVNMTLIKERFFMEGVLEGELSLNKYRVDQNDSSSKL